jgi:hypothetical protein
LYALYNLLVLYSHYILYTLGVSNHVIFDDISLGINFPGLSLTPTGNPTHKPTYTPTIKPSQTPTTDSPTITFRPSKPTSTPVNTPTKAPRTTNPTVSPKTKTPSTQKPTIIPTSIPSIPTDIPSTRVPFAGGNVLHILYRDR